jgi:hypothetical protein
VIFNAQATDLFVWLKFLRKKADGSWERPKNREGRSIKLGIEECVSILDVLNKRLLRWTTYHSFKDQKTSISFGWEDESAKKLWINLDDRKKMFSGSQIELFRRLLEHVVQEQVEQGTTTHYKKDDQ